jgi:hypothetical protein
MEVRKLFVIIYFSFIASWESSPFKYTYNPSCPKHTAAPAKDSIPTQPLPPSSKNHTINGQIQSMDI